jgi:hypothetical protein
VHFKVNSANIDLHHLHQKERGLPQYLRLNNPRIIKTSIISVDDPDVPGANPIKPPIEAYAPSTMTTPASTGCIPHNRSNEEGLRWLFGINPDMNMQLLNPVNP